MHILKMLSFLTNFERMCRRKGDSKRFDDFFGASKQVLNEHSALVFVEEMNF